MSDPARRIKAVAIDDVQTNLLLINSLGKKLNLEMELFTDPEAALTYIFNNHVDILFTDHLMDGLTGIEVLRKIRGEGYDFPIIMVTGDEDEALMIQALELGATDFLKKPLHLPEFKARATNLVRLREAQLKIEDHADGLQREVDRATADILKREMESLLILAKAAEYRDPHTAGHLSRVSRYSLLIGRGVGLSPDELDRLYHGAPLHDTGKIGIPDSILLKPGKLTDEEFEVMKSHPKIGYDIMNQARSPYMQMGAVIALSHHEKYDGTGYPGGISGDQIPLEGRIVAIADVFDALTSRRSYKNSWEISDALAYLQKESGSHFDPELVRVFCSQFDEIQQVFEQCKTDDALMDLEVLQQK